LSNPWVDIILVTNHVIIEQHFCTVYCRYERIFRWEANFLLICYYFPLEKGVDLYLNKVESPLPLNDFCQLWLKLAQRFWRRKSKTLKVQAHLTFLLRWAKSWPTN
jgi:hypothetical protein